VTSDPLFARSCSTTCWVKHPHPETRARIDLGDYPHQLIERFANPEVGDTVRRLCANASDLIPKFLLPVVREQLALAGRSSGPRPWCLLGALLEGTDESGVPNEMDDALAPQLRAAAQRQADVPGAFLTDNRSVFGELADDPRFTGVPGGLASLRERGVRATLADLDRFA